METLTDRQLLLQVRDELRLLNKAVRGDPSDSEDFGLLGSVHDNTKFRKSASKVAWVLFAAVLATWGTLLAQTVMNGGIV